MTPSRTHVVLIPSYDPGPLLLRTVQGALSAWAPVWVVVDGSTDGSADRLPPEVRVLRRARGGKGAAVRTGLEAAIAAGFTHALVMDADDQHPAARIGTFMAASAAAPGAMVLGAPEFGADAPLARVQGRRLSNWCVERLTSRGGLDALFGFRVYPAGQLLRAFAASSGMHGYDFDAEALIRLLWAGVPACVLPAPVRYWPRAAGGVSHFRYGRDNLRLTAMYLRLAAAALRR